MNLNRVPTKNPKLIQNLQENGAVITCRGNVPQFLLSIESSNTIYGITKNPFDPTRTAGGSSGGEAANIVLGFCNAAIGTDIAGSVRIPALFCGLIGFKPTTHRLSNRAIGFMFERRFGSDVRPAQVQNSLELEVIFPNQVGVITKCVEDAQKLMEVMVRNQDFDYLVPPLKWVVPKFERRIGVIRKLNVFEPCVTSSRAIDESISFLEKKGYSFVEIDVQEIIEKLDYWINVTYHFSPYIWETIKGKVSLNEELFPLYEITKKLHKLPLWVVKIAKYFEGNSRKGHALDCYLGSKKYTQAQINSNIEKLYLEFEKVLSQNRVSAILSVGLPLPALKLNSSNYLTMTCVYLYIFNFFKMPAGVCPVTKVRENEQFYESEHQDIFTETAKTCMEGAKGLPIGVQISARPFHDEIVIQVMRDLEDVWKQ